MGDEKPDGLLATIETPADLRALSRDDLRSLSDGLRQYLIQTVGPMGGHLAAGLGTVELAAGVATTITVSNTGTSGFVILDALQLIESK